jgi:DNA-directed RNA polymerase specialized sigma24 family protein
MAQTLDVPLGTVRSRLSSARAMFRRLWRERSGIGEEKR